MRKSPVIKAEDIAVLEGLIRQFSRIGLVSHTRPDGDALGSLLAMQRFLSACFGARKDCRILLDSEAPDTLRFLFRPEDEGKVLVFAPEDEKASGFAAACDLLIFLDLNQISRSGRLEPVLQERRCRRVVIDHHLYPDVSAFDLVFSETEVSSTCELLFGVLTQLAGRLAFPLPQACLNPLLAGITTDTNNFANSVFGQTLETVSALLDAGADRDWILEQLYNEYPERRIRLMGRLLDRELVITDQGVAYMILDADTAEAYDIREGETEGFVNIPLSIDRVVLSLFVREQADEYRVSIRSKRGWSAQRLAVRYFEGGGHEQASGGKIRRDEKTKNKAEVAALIERYTQEFLSHEK